MNIIEVPISRAAALEAEWSDLCAQADTPNPFFSPAFLTAALGTLATARSTTVVTIRNPEGRLDGLFPLERRSLYRGFPLRHAQIWRHPYCYLTDPLVRQGQGRAVAAAVRHWLDGWGPTTGFLVMEMTAQAGEFGAALTRPGVGPAVIVQPERRFQRALLDSPLDAAAYQLQHWSRRKRKDQRRQRRQLEGLGEVEFVHLQALADLRAALPDFLALEAQGWKGAMGTALASGTASQAFITALFAGLRAGEAEMLVLRMDDRPIAMKLNLCQPGGSFAFKIAYDPEYARFSPGVLLEVFNLETVLNDPSRGWMDSCADPDHPMIDALWTERRTMATLKLGRSSAPVRAAMVAATALDGFDGAIRRQWATLDPDTRTRLQRWRSRARGAALT